MRRQLKRNTEEVTGGLQKSPRSYMRQATTNRMQTTILNSIHFPVEGANLKFVKKKSKLNVPVYQYF